MCYSISWSFFKNYKTSNLRSCINWLSLWQISSIKAPFRLRNKLLGLQHFASMFDQEIRNYKRNRQMCLSQLTISACVPNPADMHPLIIFIGQLDTTERHFTYVILSSFLTTLVTDTFCFTLCALYQSKFPVCILYFSYIYTGINYFGLKQGYFNA